MNRQILLVTAICIAVLAVTALIVVPVLVSAPDVGTADEGDPGDPARTVVARVGDEVLYEEELRLAGMDLSHAALWARDELLAQLALERGLENPRLSRYVQRRARQVYLRDMMMEEIVASVELPTPDQVWAFMRTDSLRYMVERHYFHILLADSALADSIYTRLTWGETFQTLAQRLSIGQKAGIGGDLGFLVGGELSGRGLPVEAGMLAGLSEVYRSELGWHIFLVTETRALTDTGRVVESLTDVLYGKRIQEMLETELELAKQRILYEVDDSWR